MNNGFCDKENCIYNAVGVCINPEDCTGEPIIETTEPEPFKLNSILDFAELDDYITDEALEIYNELDEINL